MACRSDDTGGSSPQPKRKPTPPAAAVHHGARGGGGGGFGHWATKLLDTMKDPKMIVKEDETTVIIKDAYPKAKHHFLVLPKENIPSLRALNSTHVSLLKHMLEFGQSLEDDLTKKDPSLKFQHGYHAVPSMTRLHMHVISRDFNSPCLKTKKHWNSFTSEYFLPAEEVLRRLQTQGKVEVDRSKYEAVLKAPLKCHVCGEICQNMPKLKTHILKHK